MDKIGILTFQFADNYGAVLQCYALQEYAKLFCTDVKVINYKPLKMLPITTRIRRLLIKRPYRILFSDFRRKYLNIDLRCKKYNRIIVGSDQVWNPEIIKFDDFWIKPRIKYDYIYSYAASFGKLNFNDQEQKFLMSHLRDFQKYRILTLRESLGESFFSSCGIDSKVVCDPTLLFYGDVSIYDQLAQNNRIEKSNASKNSSYILVYSLESNEDMDRIATQLGIEHNLDVINIHPMNFHLQKSGKYIDDVGPCDFLYLIKNAAYIVTNSFHGLSFSYIYKKHVICVLHHSLGSRQLELIQKSGFEYSKIDSDIYEIDTNQNNDGFVEYIEESRRALVKMLDK